MDIHIPFQYIEYVRRSLIEHGIFHSMLIEYDDFIAANPLIESFVLTITAKYVDGYYVYTHADSQGWESSFILAYGNRRLVMMGEYEGEFSLTTIFDLNSQDPIQPVGE